MRAPVLPHTQQVGARDADTTVLDTVLPSPALAGRRVCAYACPRIPSRISPRISLWIHSGKFTERCRRQCPVIYMDSAYQPPADVTASAPPTSLGYYPDRQTVLAYCSTAWIRHAAMHSLSATAREQPPGNSAPSVLTPAQIRQGPVTTTSSLSSSGYFRHQR